MHHDLSCSMLASLHADISNFLYFRGQQGKLETSARRIVALMEGGRLLGCQYPGLVQCLSPESLSVYMGGFLLGTPYFPMLKE